MSRLLDIAYHASFTIEEGRRTRFRFIYAVPDDFEEQPTPTPFRQNATVRFTTPRPFTVAEVTRLAPATDPARVSLGVWTSATTDEIEIWGLIDSGSSWWDFIHHEASRVGLPPPNLFTITASEPGTIEVSRGGDPILSLRRGSVQTPQVAALWEGPVADFLRPAQDALYAQIMSILGRSRWDEDGQDDDYPHRAYVYLLQRVLHRIGRRGHGGAVILVRDQLSLNDTRIQDRMVVKYPADDTRLWDLLVKQLEVLSRYDDLHARLWDSQMVTGEDFRDHSVEDSQTAELQEALADAARFVAQLSGVDGSILMTDKLRLLGFGAEVYTSSPTLRSVVVQDAPETGGSRTMAIEEFGTRHRAAFRFASSLEDSVVFVLSQDGGPKAVKRVGPDVVMWPDVGAGY